MKKRLFGILLALCMVLCLVPTMAFTEGSTEEPPVCTCETACTAEVMNAKCSVCGADGALPENCGKYAAEESGQTGAPNNAPAITAADVQALINALPESETISEDNAADAEAQLEAIDEAKVQLSDEELAVLDFTRYDAAVAALMALSGEPGAAFTLRASASHSHCICGGSVTAGDHTAHQAADYQPWNGSDAIGYTDGKAYVYLTDNATINTNLVVDGTTLYLCLNGKEYASNGTAKIQVKNGGRLVLCDCQGGGTFKGATKDVWGGACVYLYTSRFDMFGGKLTGGKVTGSGGGGAIAMDDQQCIFNMYGGEISGNDGNNYGGAIYRKFNANMPNTTGGTFNMYGGTIKDNTAKNGGAYFSTTGGTINMTGGTISGNKATQSDNNAGGGAIYMRGSGTINISGSAQITGNSSGLDGGAVLMGWGTINISGSAKISNNTANRWGGAICLRQDSNQVTTLNMRGGEISGNRATKEGGAVHVLDKDCMFYLYDGKITGNTSGDGGAIYLNQEPSWLIMQGGEISGNTASGNGGGVYIYRTGSVCQLYSGKIENNKAGGNGGGIYINPSNSGQLRVGNKPLVQNNTVSGKANNVYLPSGKTLTIEIGMSKGASIGVTTANTGYPVAFSNDYKNNYANYFFADDVNAHVEYKDDRKLYLVSGAVARPLAVTFDPNGGTLNEADKTKSLTTGETYGTLPVPNYAGYDFVGWYTEKGGGTEIKENTTVTVFGTQTLYAHWTPIHVHAYTQQVQKPEALKTPADCTNNAVYYLSCACGEVSTNDADTFTAANTALDHDWGEWTQNSDEKTHTRICKRDTGHTETGNCHGSTADCTHKAVCTVCRGTIPGKEHALTWQSGNGEYWQKCSNCDFETEKKPIPVLTLNAPDKVCRTQDCTFTFNLPNGCTNPEYSYEFVSVGSGDSATAENGVCSGVIEAAWYAPDETSFVLTAYVTTADGFTVTTSKTVEIAEEHVYEWQSENGEYWQKCTRCGSETAKKPIPEIVISGPDTVCRTQDYIFGFTLPEGCKLITTGYEFEKIGGDLGATLEDGKYTVELASSGYPAEENSFKVTVHAETADGFAIKAEKTVAIQNEHTGGKATCKDKAKCEVCGAEYGELDPKNHTDLKHFPAKAATKTAEGNIEYWYCEGCGKYFSDRDGTQEIKEADTVTAKLKDDPKSPQTGDTGNLALWISLLLVSGGAAIGIAVVSIKKKYDR